MIIKSLLLTKTEITAGKVNNKDLPPNLPRKDYEKFKEYVGEAKEKYRFVLYGYVLMSNHYYLPTPTQEK